MLPMKQKPKYRRLMIAKDLFELWGPHRLDETAHRLSMCEMSFKCDQTRRPSNRPRFVRSVVMDVNEGMRYCNAPDWTLFQDSRASQHYSIQRWNG